MQDKFIFLLPLIFSGCLFVPNPEPVILDEVEKQSQTFIPVEIQDGLIELERKDYGDYITPAMVLIEDGNFTMGDATGLGNQNEKPTHQAEIKYEFFIGKYEITFEEYDKFVKDTKRISPNDDGWGRDKQPVINISYKDAEAYLEWLSKKTGDKYRLPTETEWEYVARAKTNSRFFFGDSIKDIKHYSWFWGKMANRPHEVGQRLPNQWNVYDIAGNVSEWCSDWYISELDAIPNNGRPYSVSTGERVLKGGSWNDFPINLRHSNRIGFAPTIKMNDTGFRAVMEY